jgi:hypothetical protein
MARKPNRSKTSLALVCASPGAKYEFSEVARALGLTRNKLAEKLALTGAYFIAHRLNTPVPLFVARTGIENAIEQAALRACDLLVNERDYEADYAI